MSWSTIYRIAAIVGSGRSDRRLSHASRGVALSGSPIWHFRMDAGLPRPGYVFVAALLVGKSVSSHMF